MDINEQRVLERKLEDLSQRIDALEERFAKAGSRLRESYGDELEGLRDKRRSAERQLAELRRREAGSWEREDLQAGIFNIFDDIGRRLDRLISKVPEERRGTRT